MPLKNGKRGKKLDKNNAGGLCKLVKLYDVSKNKYVTDIWAAKWWTSALQ